MNCYDLQYNFRLDINKSNDDGNLRGDSNWKFDHDRLFTNY